MYNKRVYKPEIYRVSEMLFDKEYGMYFIQININN